MNFLTRSFPSFRVDRSSVAERNGDEKQQQTYLDLVPSDALCYVVRSLSENPHSDFWLSFVDKKDARAVLEAGGELSVVSREMFKKIKDGDFGWYGNRDFELLVNEMTPYLEHIELVHDQLLRKINCEELVSLRTLVLDQWYIGIKLLERALKAVGGRLSELSIRGQTMKKRTVQAIAQCKSLQSLNLTYEGFKSTLEPIWKVVGNTLTKFEGHVPENELVHLKNYCIKLEMLHFHKLQYLVAVDQTGVVELLKALKCLKTFYISNDSGMSITTEESTATHISKLMEVCSLDVAVHCNLYAHPGEFPDYIRAIGPRFRVLTLPDVDFEMTSDLLPAFANVEELMLWGADENCADYEKMIESIFVEPLTSLQKLSIDFTRDSNVLLIIARSVAYLRELTCSFYRLKGDDFAQLFRANKHLRAIFLNLEVKSREAALSGILDFISTLQVCRNLIEVEIEVYIRNEDDDFDPEENSEDFDYDAEEIEDDFYSDDEENLDIFDMEIEENVDVLDSDSEYNLDIFDMDIEENVDVFDPDGEENVDAFGSETEGNVDIFDMEFEENVDVFDSESDYNMDGSDFNAEEIESDFESEDIEGTEDFDYPAKEFIKAVSKDIRDACVPLRNRSLSLSVNGLRFLPS